MNNKNPRWGLISFVFVGLLGSELERPCALRPSSGPLPLLFYARRRREGRRWWLECSVTSARTHVKLERNCLLDQLVNGNSCLPQLLGALSTACEERVVRVLVVLILFLFFFLLLFFSVLFASGNLCSSGFSRFTETGRELQITEQRFSASSRCQHGSKSYDKAVLCVVIIFLVSPSDGSSVLFRLCRLCRRDNKASE